MSEQITLENVLKSKQNFTDYIEQCSNDVIKDLLKDYPVRPLHITYPQLTQSSEGLMEAVMQLNGDQKAYIFWFIVNEKEDLKNIACNLNKYFDKNYCGIFIIKALLNKDKIEFECILKPEILKKRPRNQNTPAKLMQKEYWDKYFEVCDELQSDMQVSPAHQHYQYIPIKKSGVQIMQTLNTKDKYVATELFINNNKEIFNKLHEAKIEIEKKLGELDWQPLEGKKSSRIRKCLDFDITNSKNSKMVIKEHIKMAEMFKKIFEQYL